MKMIKSKSTNWLGDIFHSSFFFFAYISQFRDAGLWTLNFTMVREVWKQWWSKSNVDEVSRKFHEK